jgi:hypothetical protein
VLRLARVGLGPAGAQAVAATAALVALMELDLSHNSILTAAAQALVASLFHHGRQGPD